MDEPVRRFFLASGDSRRVIADEHAGYYGMKVDDHSLTPGDSPRIGPTRFEQWLTARYEPPGVGGTRLSLRYLASPLLSL